MPANHTEIEKKLWDAADRLRANSGLKASEYATPVLGLIFLRFADYKFALAQQQLEASLPPGSRRAIGKVDYQARGVMYLPEAARFSSLLALPEGADIRKAISEAMKAIEAENEDLRGIAEQLSEEELAVFDLLTRPAQTLSEPEKAQIKQAAREMLATLKREKLVLDWRKKQQTRAQVRLVIEEALDKGLPGSYTREQYEASCNEVYQHIYESYDDKGQSIYAAAS